MSLLHHSFQHPCLQRRDEILPIAKQEIIRFDRRGRDRAFWELDPINEAGKLGNVSPDTVNRVAFKSAKDGDRPPCLALI